MKKILFSLAAIMIFGSYVSTPAFAIKQFGDAWKEYYEKSSTNEGFKKLVADAKCNVCHIDGEKKTKHNPYGEEVEGLLKKKDFPADRFKSEPEKCKEEIEAAFKKVEAAKAKDGKTFGEKIKAGELPGGDIKGK
jgi:hypothetical protein